MRPDQQQLARELVPDAKSTGVVARTFDVHNESSRSTWKRSFVRNQALLALTSATRKATWCTCVSTKDKLVIATTPNKTRTQRRLVPPTLMVERFNVLPTATRKCQKSAYSMTDLTEWLRGGSVSVRASPARSTAVRLRCRAAPKSALLHSVWNLGDVACVVARPHQEEWKNQRFWRPCRSRRSRL